MMRKRAAWRSHSHPSKLQQRQFYSCYWAHVYVHCFLTQWWEQCLHSARCVVRFFYVVFFSMLCFFYVVFFFLMCTPGTIHLRKHTQQPHNNLEPYTQNTHPYTTHTGIRHSSFLCGVCSHPLRLKFKRTRLLIEVCRQKAHQKHLVDIQSGIWCCHYEQHARAWSVFAGGVVSGLELDVHIRGGHYCWYVDVLMC